jgi:hypothetical protein
MIDDKRIAELTEFATKYPGSFYKTITGEDVLGLITRVAEAEAYCQRIAEAHIACGNARAIDMSPPPSCGNLDSHAGHYHPSALTGEWCNGTPRLRSKPALPSRERLDKVGVMTALRAFPECRARETEIADAVLALKPEVKP